MRVSVPLLVAALLLLAGCSTNVSTHFSAFERVHSGLSLQPGDWEEVNLCLRAGESVDYSWTSSANLHFDIHSHGAGAVVKQWVSENGTSGSGKFTATVSDVYSPFWENLSSQPVTLNYMAKSNGSEYRPGHACPA